MKRDYNTGVHSDIHYFTGIEIEKTKFYRQETLFVAKFPLDLHEIQNKIDISNKNITHIFIGANNTLSQYIAADDYQTLIALIDLQYNISFDGTLDEVSTIIQHIKRFRRDAAPRLCGIIQIKIPNVIDLAYNSMYIKICEDIPSMQEVTNQGVWVCPLSNIISDDKLTRWEEYKQDKII